MSTLQQTGKIVDVLVCSSCQQVGCETVMPMSEFSRASICACTKDNGDTCLTGFHS